MNWQDIEISLDRNYFIYGGMPIFQKKFLSVLEFQHPGIACVQVENGWVHIDSEGNPIYKKIYDRVFGFYFNRAAVLDKKEAYHVGLDGLAAYKEKYLWVGNYQENVSVVKDLTNHYFHIDLDGNLLYPQKYIYAGDFKEGIACDCGDDGYYTHIDKNGNLIHGKQFRLLDVYHKGYARAMDEKGWFHIDREGNSIYNSRFSLIEPFYNGFAFCITLEGKQVIVDESGAQTSL